MQYLLAQTNRGDLLSQQVAIGNILPEIVDEDREDECADVTIPQVADIAFQVILCKQFDHPPKKFINR